MTPRDVLQIMPMVAAVLAAQRADEHSARARAEKERDAAMADVGVFATMCSIQTADGEEHLFGRIAWPWQYILLILWAQTRLTVVLKARQLGVSWLAAIYALWTAMRRPGQSVLLISKGQEDADKLLEKVAYVYARLPSWRPRVLINTRSIRFPDLGSEIEAMPATESVGRSRTANLVILDEHAHQRWAREILQAVQPAIGEDGKILSISSANGLGALHTQLYLTAKGGSGLSAVQLPDKTPLPLRVSTDVGANGWRAVFVPASAHPDRVGDWRARARAEMAHLSDAMFAQEYPENDAEAIVATGRPVFRPEDLQRQPVEPGTAGEQGVRFFREPRPGEVYLIGADVGEGLSTSDWSTASVVERERGEQVASLRGRWTPDVFAEKLDRLARHYAKFRTQGITTVIVGVERNNHGHAVLLRLSQLLGSGLTYRIYRAKDKRLGWLTMSANRPVLIDQLEEALRTEALVLHDAATVDQFGAFAYNDDGRPEAAEGYHDDDVMAVGIAWQVRRRSYPRVIDIRREEATAA